MPVIDFHLHPINYQSPSPSFTALMRAPFAGDPEYREFLEKYSDPAVVAAMLRESGADYGVVLADYSPMCTGYMPNEQVRDFCSGQDELIPFCSINPYLDPDPCATLEEFCGRQGFRGVKLYPTYDHFYPNEARLYPIYALAQEMRIPVMFHTGSSVFTNARIKYGNPIFFDDLAIDFPRLSLVMSHGGRGAWYAEAMTMVRLHENVYIDCTGLPVRKLPEYFPEMERFSSKFIFGSDWPESRLGKTLARYGEIGLSEEALRRILGGNAARLLGL